ncbi:MAG: hypothetical protein HYS13_17000, partial [Planctomycetia bacterium]|nr:hypothetical protein [Planctomycetia bacterium]
MPARRSRKSHRKRRLPSPAATLFLPLALCVFCGCGDVADGPATGGAALSGGAAQGVKNTPAVRVTDVRSRPFPRVVRVQGSLMADEQAVVGAKVAGRVQEVKVDLGTVVQRGTEIALLDKSEFELRVREA